MGKVASKITRHINRFNVENRAHRVLDRDKPTAAPKFDSNIQDLQRALELDPKLVEKLNKKDSHLDDRLKNVYVTSEDRYIDHVKIKRESDERTLPLDRKIVQDFEYGYKEPVRVTPGRCTLRTAMKFITDHQGEPDLWTTKKIADEYKIKEETVGKILYFFKSFQIYIPDINSKDNILTQANPNLIDEKKEKENESENEKEKGKERT
ncbi:protein NDUFAF4 homolog [Episyrphus balteatus]|uniref:protein NDUFAF4 homolog n=1 Tax=Episyrphus balteatus TaxID=286459 RepID=UPI002486AF42|nr:protein NDUFAF4 homolog [Episyrphus balteatus]